VCILLGVECHYRKSTASTYSTQEVRCGDFSGLYFNNTACEHGEEIYLLAITTRSSEKVFKTQLVERGMILSRSKLRAIAPIRSKSSRVWTCGFPVVLSSQISAIMPYSQPQYPPLARHHTKVSCSFSICFPSTHHRQYSELWPQGQVSWPRQMFEKQMCH
jgi:hypothetical protein